MRNPATEQLFQTIMALPADERWELVDQVIEADRSADDLPFDPAWLDIIRARSAEIDAGTVEATPWPIVRERVRRRVEGRSGD